jgi:hypothetical protein
MHAAVKVIIGIIILVIGLGLFVDSAYSNTITGVEIHWLENFVIVLTGIIPIFLILVGLFVIWLEVDELKAEKEFKLEEEKEKARPAAKPLPRPVKKTARRKR